HLTRPTSPRISNSSPGCPSTAKKSSTRRWRFPSWTGSARISSIVSGATVSGDSSSASSGTVGASLRVSVIIGRESALVARDHFGMTEALHLDGVVRKRHGVDLFEQRPDVVLDRVIAGGTDDELPAVGHLPHVSFLDDDVAALDDVARIREEKPVI